MTLLLHNVALLFIATVLASREGDVRLSIGSRVTTHSGQGNVEVFHKGRWGSICDDEWDDAEGTVVCKALGFPGVDVVTHDGEFGDGGEIFMDDIFCTGVEKTLTDCHFPGWKVHDCQPTELAGVRCLSAVKPATSAPIVETNNSISIVDVPGKAQPFFEPLRRIFTNDLEIRLRAGRHSLEGRLEIFNDQQKRWGLVCSHGFGMLETMTVCRQAGFAYGNQHITGKAFGPLNSSMPMEILGLKCTGDEINIADCLYSSQLTSCPDDDYIGVICAEELPDLVIDKDELERSTYLEDRQLSFLTCSMEENCLSSSAYEVPREEHIFHTRRLLRFTTRVANTGTVAFRPFLPKDQWIWHACHQHFHSMEVFAHYDILSPQGVKVAEGHKASFCLEDNFCDPSATQTYSCADRGDQGISVGCVDSYLHNIDCQWVDMTDVPIGNYTFRVAINPDYKLAEATFDNNGASCQLVYTETYAAVRNCNYVRP